MVKSKKSLITIGYLFLASFIPLMLCSKCSFLYPFNDWYDINILFTMGKGLLSGKVPYVDLIDQKGPYGFLFFGLMYLISHKSFLGVFFAEVISMFAFLFINEKTMELYSKQKHYALLPMVSFAIASSRGFVHGGSFEELSLPFLAFALYTLIKYLKTKKISFAEIFINGLMAGILFWTKFTLVGLFIAWVLLFSVFYIVEKKYLKLIKSAGVFLGGFLVVTIPWIIYFLSKKSLHYLFETYIFRNAFGYTNDMSISILAKIKLIIVCAGKFYLTKGNILITTAIFVGMAIIVFYPTKKISFSERITVLVSFLVTDFCIFFSGHAHDYYGLASAVFFMFPCMASCIILEKGKDNKFVKKISSKWYVFLVALICGVFISCKMGDNIYMLGMKKEEMPQYRFAKIISESEDRTVLNYGFLDCGIYTVLDTLPSVKEYCTLNLDYYGMLQKQAEYVADSTTEFVITWNEIPYTKEEVEGLFPDILKNYEIADITVFYIEGAPRTYTLWQRR